MGLFRKKKKAHTPVEAKESGRSKQRIKIVEVLSEGEIEGLVEGIQSVYLDKTPIEAKDGSYYFKNVEIEGREGTQTQEVMQGFQAVEKEISVATEITKRTALTRTVTDANVNRLRLTLGVQALFEQNDQGDTHSATVEFKITVGTQQIPFTIKGKYNSSYSRAIIVENLPRVPFTIKVERITADSTSNRLANKTMWASYTEIIDAQFRYPNTAYMGVKFDSEYFNNIPTCTYEIYGIKVRVPSNYDPEARTYAGLWDGTFKVAYTNNPAWILMDIVTHKRYGLGDRLGEFSVDKWALYQIAQYCDQMIPDGFGGQEPRFTCNLWLTEQRSAYDVLSDLCSIFRAIPVWNGTELTFIMDRPSDPVWTYTNANVVGGQFSRQYSAMKARHNAIQVEYKDAENNYESTIEYISDDEQIRKFGLNLKKVTAFGCTSRGQAFRTGKWILETERLETETITFTVGSEGLMNIPGDIIRVSDNHFAGTNIGGRVQAIHGRILTLDREIQFSANHFLSYINAQAKHQKIRITAVSGKQVTLESDPVGLSLQGVWSLLTQTVASQLYRCMTVTENEEGTYTIFALQHEPQKEAIVDNGASFEPRNTSVIKTPTLESLNAEATPNGLKLNWSSTAGAGTLTYDIKILKADNLYAYHKGVSSTEFSTDNLPDGDYTVVVIAKNASGQMVSEKSQNFTINRPPVPRDVVVLGGLGNITISWAWVDDFTQTEIWVSEQDNLATAQRLTKLNAKMYSHEVGAKQVRYYWLRHVRGQNVGAFYQQSGLRGESSVDIDKELKLLNEKLSKNIVNDVIDTALPARKLEMVKTVANLNVNQFQGVKQVYNERDGKLYLWNGSQYTSKIQASEIAGQLNQNQLDNELITQLNTAKDSATQAVAQSQEAKRKVAELSSEFNNINFDVGARNYLLNSAENRTSWTVSQSAKESWQGKKLTLSFSLNAKGIIRGGRNRVGLSMFLYYTDNTYTWIECWLSNHQGDYSGRLKSTIQLLDKPIKSISNCSFKVEVGGGTCVATNPKLEIGSIATDWSPAPEDLTTTIQFEDIKRSLTNESNTRIAWENESNSRMGSAEATIQQLATSQANENKAQAGKLTALTTRVDGAEGKIAHAERSISTLNSTATTKFSQLEANLNSAKEDLRAKITAEQTARANENKAQADELKKITASVNGATAQISTVSKVVADVKGQLTATHTIKTQTISGNHAAIAGISLGANKEQSSVIVMADKFQVVKNAQDGSPKPMLSVVNDQIAINGDLIANGQITAAKLAAGAVRADHFAAGEISADKLAIGLGGNLFQNPIFANNGNGWTLYVNPSQIANAGWSFNRNTGDHQGYSYLETENQFHWQAARTNSDTSNVRFGGLYQDLKLVKGRYYCFSAYVGGHRSFQDLNIEQGEVQIIRKSWTGRGKNGGYDAGAGISSGVEEERRIYIIFKANGNANQNYRLIINQWAEGAQHNPMMKIRRPMLEECTEHTKVPSPWQNAGVTAIHGGSIVTNSITAQQIAANTITGNEIVGETIAGKHIASKSITAKKLYVENLSAISADLGNITGGSLNINNRFKVSNQGQVEMRAAAGNVELVINNNQIIVYDERGNVRVKIGQL